MNLICEINKPQQWYAIYTKSRAEKKVTERLFSNGIICFLPLIKVQRRWSDRVKTIEVPLFNSYVFVKINKNNLFSLLKIEGVVKVLYFNGEPAVIREKDIMAMKDYIQMATNCEMLLGDQVEIVCGEMAKAGKIVSGKIKRINKKYLTLYVEQLGATICVKETDVKKI